MFHKAIKLTSLSKCLNISMFSSIKNPSIPPSVQHQADQLTKLDIAHAIQVDPEKISSVGLNRLGWYMVYFKGRLNEQHFQKKIHEMDLECIYINSGQNDLLICHQENVTDFVDFIKEKNQEPAFKRTI